MDTIDSRRGFKVLYHSQTETSKEDFELLQVPRDRTGNERGINEVIVVENNGVNQEYIKVTPNKRYTFKNFMERILGRKTTRESRIFFDEKNSILKQEKHKMINELAKNERIFKGIEEQYIKRELYITQELQNMIIENEELKRININQMKELNVLCEALNSLVLKRSYEIIEVEKILLKLKVGVNENKKWN